MGDMDGVRDTVVIQFDKDAAKFGANRARGCSHLRVEISVSESEVLCKDCNVRLNPVWFISNHLTYLNEISKRNTRLLAKKLAIEDVLKKKAKFMCEHCHEVNTIHFERLPSAKAIERKMALIDAEDEGGKIQYKQITETD